MAAKINRLISCCGSLVICRSFSVSYKVPAFQSANKGFSSIRSQFSRIRMSSTSANPTSTAAITNAEPTSTNIAETNDIEASNSSVQGNEVVLENAKADSALEQTECPTSQTSNPLNNSESNSTEEKKYVRVPKIKAAVLLSYSGQGYFGLQMQNSGARTIENDLLKAFLDAGVIDEEGFQKPKSIKFQRAARTDKNVSAARNIISMMVPKTFDPDAVNKFLPDQVRIMDYRRVTKGFDAKNACNARTYLYMIPTFAFVPLEEKVEEEYRITPEVLERVRALLKMYEGSKNYHNFTSRRKPTDPSSYRYIMSFSSSEPFVQDGLEYVVLKVKGQSFMMHQIRKMIGLVIAIGRGFACEETMKRAFTLEKIDIPMAPGLGLMLGETHYDHYNRKFGTDGIHEPLIWDNVAEKIEQFCKEKIYQNVTKTENEEKSTFQWLSTVAYHTFDTRLDDVPRGYGPLGKANMLAKKERGEWEEDSEQDEEDSDDEAPKKKRRSN